VTVTTVELTGSAVKFVEPHDPPPDGVHHAAARTGNDAVAAEASAKLAAVLDGDELHERVLLKTAAGAGKSYVLKRLVRDAVAHENTRRVAVVAFTNKQIHPLAADLGDELGRDKVCLFVSAGRVGDVPTDVSTRATVVTSTADIPDSCVVIVATCHKLGAFGERKRQLQRFGAGVNGDDPFDVLFVDEAWQVAHHVFRQVTNAAPVRVGVGDVGQLPPIEVGTNPWRGDPGHNPWRAWPTDYENDGLTWSVELPAVHRPAAGHLGLWRAFYPSWHQLNCVAAPGDRTAAFGEMPEPSAAIWAQVATGVPTLIEVDGLLPADAADVDLPLVEFVESLLDDAFAAGFTLFSEAYGDDGDPTGEVRTQSPGDTDGNPLVAVLATRNQAVDDAADAVDRLRDKHGLAEYDLLASTVDSWQGQTNGFTVAIHPLSGASRLDDFNSAFGRLAVTCTRATHGLLLVSRPGLDDLLRDAPARPGTPFGEPGVRQLPRQTHRRILATFARGRLTVTSDGEGD
jgi:AAA domain